MIRWNKKGGSHPHRSPLACPKATFPLFRPRLSSSLPPSLLINNFPPGKPIIFFASLMHLTTPCFSLVHYDMNGPWVHPTVRIDSHSSALISILFRWLTFNSAAHRYRHRYVEGHWVGSGRAIWTGHPRFWTRVHILITYIRGCPWITVCPQTNDIQKHGKSLKRLLPFLDVLLDGPNLPICFCNNDDSARTMKTKSAAS